ncbi:secreted RxLR effector protein 161-like protein [Tanacetum coccineum]
MSATSSNHSKILAIHEASRECLWLRSVTQHIRKLCGISLGQESPTIVHEDNSTCIALLKDEYIKGDKTKHILPKFLFTHDLHKSGDIIVQKVRLSDNQANLFTKALPTTTSNMLVYDTGMRRLNELKSHILTCDSGSPMTACHVAGSHISSLQTMLNEFVIQFDKVVDTQRAAIEDEDFNTMNSRPVFHVFIQSKQKLVNCQCYTKMIFELFQKEWIEGSNNLTHETKSKSDEKTSYWLRQVNVDKKYWRVVNFCFVDNLDVTCSCAMYEGGNASIGIKKTNCENGVSALSLWDVQSNWTKAMNKKEMLLRK